MKIFITFTILICLAFPVFSQSASSDRFKALSDSMGRTISNTTANLEDYDEQLKDNGNIRTFAFYNRRHETLRQALAESERRLDLLIRTNDRRAVIREERDNYERLLRNLETLKSDYDSWQRNAN